MSSYAVKNLMEIEPGGDGDGFELRFARKYLGSQELGISHERFAPNYTSTFGHHHDVQEEAYVVVEGSGAIKLDDERIELKQWDVVRVAPEVVRGFDAGPDGLTVIAVGGRKPEGGDGHPIENRWPA
jgi:mannose-6-phosphate isomerase-like protein (cupin superfamily)